MTQNDFSNSVLIEATKNEEGSIEYVYNVVTWKDTSMALEQGL